MGNINQLSTTIDLSQYSDPCPNQPIVTKIIIFYQPKKHGFPLADASFIVMLASASICYFIVVEINVIVGYLRKPYSLDNFISKMWK